MFIPNGRLSAVEHGEEKVQIQTEFAAHPRPRVTTSVMLAGRVVHKEEQPWEAETETPEGQQNLEQALKRQHIEVHERVESNGIELAPRPQAAASKVKMPELRTPAPPVRHRGANAQGVLRLFIVSKNGDLLAADDSGVPSPSSAGLFVAAAEFIEFFESVESERFNQMLTRDRDSNYLLVRHFGKFWGAELAPGSDPEASLSQFLKALEP
jgi:hypothetical protein